MSGSLILTHLDSVDLGIDPAVKRGAGRISVVFWAREHRHSSLESPLKSKGGRVYKGKGSGHDRKHDRKKTG